MSVRQAIRARLHPFEAREILEERVAGTGRDDRLARVAEQLEEPAIGLGGRRAEKHVAGVDRRRVTWFSARANGAVLDDRVPGAPQAPRVGLVAHVRRVGEQAERMLRGAESYQRRVALGEVEHGDAAGPQVRAQLRQGVVRRGPGQPGGEGDAHELTLGRRTPAGQARRGRPPDADRYFCDA